MPEFRPMEANNPEAEPRFENLANIYLPMRNSVPEPTTTTRGQSSYKCPNCNRVYRRASCLRRHMRMECGKHPRYQCRICNGKFTYKHNLTAHMKLHVEEPKHTYEFGLLEGYDKKFICGVCQRAYSTLQALQFHQRIECNREPKYKCVYCSYKTVRQTNLRRHMSTHL
ncbi:zinc finger protein 468 isoform X1 [Microplitis demolitor]|uniref:zinc finger protein 468 isoform X1 n=1 Tax=Microplitis demolitor TaxID=69319 RepID=UPI00235B5D08|nr:zinc finger protein 468 isoform X1 [Microplitis demolitor]